MENTSERPYSLTIDFGDVLHSQLVLLSETSGKSKATIVRTALRRYLAEPRNTISEEYKLEESKRTGRVTRNDVNKIISTYNNIFYSNSNPRHFYPAVYKVVTQAIKNGLEIKDIIQLISISKSNRFVHDRWKSGKPLALSSLLSANMIDTLMKDLTFVKDKEVARKQGGFREFQFMVLDKYFREVSSDISDDFRNEIMNCTNKDEVREVLSKYAIG